MSLSVDPLKAARVREIRDALATAWWYFTRIHVKAKDPSNKVTRCSVTLGREGYISVNSLAVTADDARVYIALPPELSTQLIEKIRSAFDFSFAQTGLIGQAFALEAEPGPAELDWAFRTLKPYLPDPPPPTRYHVLVQFTCEVEGFLQPIILEGEENLEKAIQESIARIEENARMGAHLTYRMSQPAKVIPKKHAIIRVVEEKFDYPELI